MLILVLVLLSQMPHDTGRTEHDANGVGNELLPTQRALPVAVGRHHLGSSIRPDALPNEEVEACLSVNCRDYELLPG